MLSNTITLSALNCDTLILMNKTLKLIAVIVIAAAVIAGVAFGANIVSGSLADSGKVSSKCSGGQHKQHEMEIKNDKFSPALVKAVKCDTLVIKNLDNKGRLIAFGKHDKHIAYDGVTERYLLKNEEFKVTLNKTGDFLIHDHNQDEVQASFIVVD